MKIKLNAPAKINLALDILDKRADGYHLVKMVMQTINLFDIVTIEQKSHKEIKIFCTDQSVPTGEHNLAYKAAQKFFSFAKIPNEGIDISIEKHIPVAAGLAGGSSDAAAVLVGLNHMYENILPQKRLLAVGAMIGADVPFCIQGSTMLAEGIGTVLTKLNNLPDCYIVLAKPFDSVSTKEAYLLNDSKSVIEQKNIDITVEAIQTGNLKKISKLLYNRFEHILTLPEVSEIREKMINHEALGACMSGSGPTVFSIFDNENKAKSCYEELKKSYNEVFICHPFNEGSQLIKE